MSCSFRVRLTGATALAILAILAILTVALSPGQIAAAGEAAAHVAPATAVTTPSLDRWHRPEWDALIRQGVEHDRNGDLERANEVWQHLGEVAPHHPAGNLHTVDTLIWLQLFDDQDPAFDERIEKESEEAIRKAEIWVKERPEDARAHLYLGHALMNLGRLHGIRMRIYRAGTYAEKAREELERALELDPTLTDAKYSIGLYFYYASLIPDVVQWLSFLWFVPTPDAPLGLRYLEEVAEEGELFRFTAAFYITNIRTYHEKHLDRPWGLAGLERLYQQHPRNSLLHFELLESLMLAGRFQEVVTKAKELESHAVVRARDRGRANMARVWRARAEINLGRPESALAILESFGEHGPAEPSWGNQWVEVSRGQSKDMLGRRDEAIAHYQGIVDLELNPVFARSLEFAEQGIEEPFRGRPQISARSAEE